MLAASLVGGSGIFGIQKAGMQIGAVMDPLSNQLVSITNPRQQTVPAVGLAALCCTVMYVLAVGYRRFNARGLIALYSSFVVGSVVLVSWGWASGPITGTATDIQAGEIPPAFPGWVEAGSKESAVHLVVILAIVVLVLTWRRAPARQSRVAIPVVAGDEPATS